MPEYTWCHVQVIISMFILTKTTNLTICSLNSSDAGGRIFQFWESIPFLMMPWLLKMPEHQQAWYWLCRIDNMYYCCFRVNLIYLGQATPKIWFKMWIWSLVIFNSLGPSDAIWCTEICVNIGSGNGLLPDGTKPLPEPMLTYHKYGPVVIAQELFYNRYHSHQLLKWAWNALIKTFI